jgi:hypothetical protein
MGSQLSTRRSTTPRKNLWFERVMAIVATANLGLVLFDLSYVPWRNFWLQGNILIPLTGIAIKVPIPQIDCPDASVPSGEAPRTIQQSAVTCLYDRVKGIEPHRDTQKYLDTVKQLEQQIAEQGIADGFRSSQVQATLDSLRNQSTEIIAANPFEAAGKSGTLEKIKNRMRQQVYGNRSSKESSREAFSRFWSSDRLSSQWQQEISWFNSQVAPLMQTNYYRSIDETGNFTNLFWLVDLPFVLLFGLEFAARTFYLSRRHGGLSWLDAVFWRWYDIPLFFPFGAVLPGWAWLRALPVVIRWHQAELVNLGDVSHRATRLFIGSVANEITEVVVIQVIDQVQGVIQRGELARTLAQFTSQPRAEVNNVDEIAAIGSLLVKLTVYQVLPKVQPDVEALLLHNINGILNQSPAFRSLVSLPGMASLTTQLSQTLVQEVLASVYKTLTSTLEDPIGAELTQKLVQHFSETFGTEIQQQNTVQEIQSLLTDLLEEVKLNYVQRSTDITTESILAETRQLRKIAYK